MGGKRFTEQHPNIPVIFTSGYPRSILVESGLEENDGYQFLQKPYTTQTLLEKIRSVLAAQRSHSSCSTAPAHLAMASISL